MCNKMGPWRRQKPELALFIIDLWICSLISMCFLFSCLGLFPSKHSRVTSLFFFMELSLLFWFAAKTDDLFWRGDTVAAPSWEKRGSSSGEGENNPPYCQIEVIHWDLRKNGFQRGRTNKRTDQEEEDMKILIIILIAISSFSLDVLHLQTLEGDATKQSKKSRSLTSFKTSQFTLQHGGWNTSDLTVTAVTSFGGLSEWESYHTAAAHKSKPITHTHPPLCLFR